MNENNLENVTSLSSDLITRENITIQLEELLIAGNYEIYYFFKFNHYF